MELLRLRHVGYIVIELCKERCRLSGNKDVAYKVFDPEKLYTPVVKHETIRVFLVKSSTQCLMVEGADLDKEYLYGNITDGVKIIIQKPTDNSQVRPCMDMHVECWNQRTACAKKVKYGEVSSMSNLYHGDSNNKIKINGYTSMSVGTTLSI